MIEGLPLPWHWHAWRNDEPAGMLHRPSGFGITPLAYSARTGTVNRFLMGPAVRLGTNTPLRVECELGHAGTRIAWRWTREDAGTVALHWRALEHGEWGLRWWLVLALSFEDGRPVQLAQRAPALRFDKPPLLVTAHADLEGLVRELEEHGYWYLASRGEEGPLLALRFNLEEMPENEVRFGFDDRRRLPAERARSTPEAAVCPEAALRDVIRWNTVWDAINERPYTCLSRAWNLAKFGGFGVWLNDLFYHALMAAHFDPWLAERNLEAVFAHATEDGNLPCLVTGHDAWVDRSQPPIGALVVREISRLLERADIAERWYEALKANHEWWWRRRDPTRAGLVAYGTSDVGTGLYKGTALACRNESAMDNSPVHDTLRYDPQTRTLDGFDIGLNSLLCLDAERLADLAGLLNRPHDVVRFTGIVDGLRRRIRTWLWDEERCVFAGRHRDGRFVQAIAPTSFLPLLAGACDQRQQHLLLTHWFDPPERLGGDIPVPSVERGHPSYGEQVYWRGRVWPPLNYLVWRGLRRAGEHERARDLATRSWRLFERAHAAGACPENYNATTGTFTDSPDTDPYYGWGALLSLMAVEQERA